MSINKKEYKPYGPFKLWTIENFPFIEADFDAITNYQLYSKIVEFCNKLKINQDLLQESNNELINAFNSLENYVENYFENLDVQEEIDNKLDEMVEDGTLQEIIASYLQANTTWTFDTVSDMKSATNLIVGSYTKTLGYNNINDGGGATYYITDTGTANEEDVIAVGDLFANLIVPDKLTPQMFGAYGDETHDDTEIIQDCINYVSNKPIKLFLDRKYLVSPIVTTNERNVCFLLKTNIIIEGNGVDSGLIIDDTNHNKYWAVFYADGNTEALSNITIDNFQIYQDDENLSDIEVTNKNPRYIFYTSNSITNYTINNILFNHVYSRDVIMITSGEITSNVKITNCIINYFSVLDRVTCTDSTAIFINCKNYICNDNILYGANFTCKGGIELHGHDGTAQNNKIIGFTDCLHVQPSGTNPANFGIYDNYMYGYDGINLWDSSNTSPSTTGLKNVIIENNFIQVECTQEHDDMSNGIRLSSSSFTHPVDSLFIKNNTIDFINIDTTRTISSAYSGGITFNNSTTSMTNLIIENNVITNSVSSGICIGTTSGTATTTNENIIVRGNIIKDSGRLTPTNTIHNSSILFYNKYLKNIVVENNILINNIEEGGSEYAFYNAGSVADGYPCYYRYNIIKSVNSGDMTVGGISTWVYQTDKQIPIFSPNGTKYYIKVANDGTLSTTS